MKKMSMMNTADRRERKILIGFIIVTAVLFLTWLLLVGVRSGFGGSAKRTNPEQEGTPRVYDQAGMLTEEQKSALEKRIDEVQKEIRADIVIVLLNESLEAKYPDLNYYKYDDSDAFAGIRRYAESFWTENGFGWNKPGKDGNGIIMVDNIYRESTGWVYNWVAGSGDLHFSIGNESCQKLSQKFTDRLPYGDMPPKDPVYADALLSFVDDCRSFGNRVRGMMGWENYTPAGIFRAVTSSVVALAIVIVLLVIILGRMFWMLKYNGKRKKRQEMREDADPGKTPFAAKDYLVPDAYKVLVNDVKFVRHYRTSVTHKSSSGSGGGGGGGFSGGHSSGGGGFSGGGSRR